MEELINGKRIWRIMGNVDANATLQSPEEAIMDAARTIDGHIKAAEGKWGDSETCRKKALEIHQYFLDELLETLKNDPAGRGQVILATYRERQSSTYELLGMEPAEDY